MRSVVWICCAVANEVSFSPLTRLICVITLAISTLNVNCKLQKSFLSWNGGIEMVGGRKFGVGDVDYLMQVGKKELRVLGKYWKIKKKTQWWNFNIPKIENQTFILSTIFLHFPNQFLSIAFWFVTIQFISLQAHHGKGRQTFSISLLAQCFFFIKFRLSRQKSKLCVHMREREKSETTIFESKRQSSRGWWCCVSLIISKNARSLNHFARILLGEWGGRLKASNSISLFRNCFSYPTRPSSR